MNTNEHQDLSHTHGGRKDFSWFKVPAISHSVIHLQQLLMKMMAKILTFMINFFMGSRKNELDAHSQNNSYLAFDYSIKKEK